MLKIRRYKTSRFWALLDENDALVCVCVYRRGAANVARLLRRLHRSPADSQEAPPDHRCCHRRGRMGRRV